MTRLAIHIASAFILIGLTVADEDSKSEKGFVSIFDGKTLNGWEGDSTVFRVKNGAIHAGDLKNQIKHNHFLCTTKRYGNFELRLQAKLVGEGKNAGIQFRSERIPNHHEVKGYQCDMGVMRDKPIWGWLYDESRRRKFLVEANAEKLAKVVKSGEWNEIVIRCEDAHVQIWVNGFKTVDYVEKQKDIPQKGIIGLQIHGGKPAVASYRKIRIKPLGE